MIPENNFFDIRSYTKTELAQQFNPELSQARARQILHRWIVNNPELCQELKQCGYKDHSQILTPKQVGTIVKHLGEP